MGNVALKACYHHTNLHHHVKTPETADLKEGLAGLPLLRAKRLPPYLLSNMQGPFFSRRL